MADGGSKSPLSVQCSLPGDAVGDVTLVGQSPLFKHVLTVADAVAKHDCIVLLEGESGTGKELLARRIHQRSERSNAPFIPVNCPAISDTLFESQFYGHVKGAFTGADTATLGMVRAAEGGSLLLDEVGELPLHLQPKLLRLLQDGEVTPVGQSKPISVNTRFIAATNRSLASSVAKGEFRSDLYHRLNIVRIEIPPLRARAEDIEPLVDFYLCYYAKLYVMPERRLGSRLRRSLREYPWFGNVRELCAYIERLYAANIPPMPPSMDNTEAAHWQGRHGLEPAPHRMPQLDYSPVGCSLAQAEAKAIRHALEAADYNRSAAARILQIHRSTLLRKMRSHGLDEGAR